MDREGDRDGDRACGDRGSGQEDARAHRHRTRCIVHESVRTRCSPSHPACAPGRRHEGRNHHGPAAREPAGTPHDVPRRADPARGARSASEVATIEFDPPDHYRQGLTMNFLDGSLFPENQEKLIITAAPYGPEWMPSDFPEDIPVTMEAQVQKAVDCYNAGASVLHLHVRELDGKGSKRLSKFNELIAGIRARVPELVIQVGGSISFAPESEGSAAKWLSDDTRHMLAELDPKPDQVTVTVNTSQMNVLEHWEDADVRGTSLAEPAMHEAYRDMIVPSNPSWYEEHIRRLSEAGIQSEFQCYNINSYETIERLIRRGV